MRANCSIPDCEAQQYVRGWCVAHYTRWWRHGSPLVTIPRSEVRAKISAAMNGNQSSLGRVLSPETRAKISASRMGQPNTSGHIASPEARAAISASRSVPLGSTRRSNQGYILVKIAHPNIWQKRSRVVAGLIPGDGKVAHHKDGNKLNDEPDNLQVFESTAAHSRHHRSQEVAR